MWVACWCCCTVGYLPGVVNLDCHIRPVVQASPLQAGVVYLKAQGPHQMKPNSSGSTRPCNCPWMCTRNSITHILTHESILPDLWQHCCLETACIHRSIGLLTSTVVQKILPVFCGICGFTSTTLRSLRSQLILQQPKYTSRPGTHRSTPRSARPGSR